MSTPAPTAPPARYANGRFGPGNPGRRIGARSRVSHRAVMAILEDFELHKDAVMKRLREYHAPAYFAILNRLLERELKAEAPSLDDYSEGEIAQTIRLARQVLSSNEDPRTALLELDAVLVNQTSIDPAAPANRINGD